MLPVRSEDTDGVGVTIALPNAPESLKVPEADGCVVRSADKVAVTHSKSQNSLGVPLEHLDTL